MALLTTDILYSSQAPPCPYTWEQLLCRREDMLQGVEQGLVSILWGPNQGTVPSCSLPRSWRGQQGLLLAQFHKFFLLLLPENILCVTPCLHSRLLLAAFPWGPCSCLYSDSLADSACAKAKSSSSRELGAWGLGSARSSSRARCRASSSLNRSVKQSLEG